MFDDADLRELSIQLGPGRHAVLERLVDLRALDVDEDQGVDGGEDGEEVLILAEVTAITAPDPVTWKQWGNEDIKFYVSSVRVQWTFCINSEKKFL